MAIKKAIKVPCQYEPEHWVITQIQWDKLTGHSAIHVCGWKDEQAYRDKKPYVNEAIVRILPGDPDGLMDLGELEKAGMNVRKRAYELIKKRPEFAGGEDV